MVCPKCGYMMDAFDKECPRCKRMGIGEEKITEKENEITKAADEAIVDAEIISSQQTPIEKYIRCPHCHELMNIAATKCPHCGTQGGPRTLVVNIGIAIGALIGITITMMMSKSDDLVIAFFFDSLFLSPRFWLITFPLMIIGSIIADSWYKRHFL